MTAASSAPAAAAAARAASAARSAARRSARAASAARSASASAARARGGGLLELSSRLRRRPRPARLELGQLLAEPLVAAPSSASSSRLERGDPLAGALRGIAGLPPARASSSSSWARAALGALGGGAGPGRGRARGACRSARAAERAANSRRLELLALAALRGERLLGRARGAARRRPARCSASSRSARAAAAAASASASRRARPRARRRAPARSAPRAVWRSSRSCSSAASAWRLSGRSRERASRSTSSARERFSSVRSSFSWARRRRLRCLPRPGGLLDQQPPLARPREHDRLDPALGDDRVHLLAEAGVGQHLGDVGQPAAGAVEAVLALARRGRAGGRSRSRRTRVSRRPVGVVDDDLDLGGARALDAVAAGEDHVLHRLAAHGERALLAERPQDGVGDVRLARAVGADDHRHARARTRAWCGRGRT